MDLGDWVSCCWPNSGSPCKENIRSLAKTCVKAGSVGHFPFILSPPPGRLHKVFPFLSPIETHTCIHMLNISF